MAVVERSRHVVRAMARAPLGGRFNRSLATGAVMLAIVIVGSIFLPFLMSYSPDTPDLEAVLAPPGQAPHFLGTDGLGRDLLTRIVYGGQISLLVSSLGMLGSMTVGIIAGLLATFGTQRIELAVVRLIDVQLAFPYILLAIAITSAVTPSIPLLIFLMVLAGWAAAARVVRSVALQEASKDYVKAAALVGASQVRIAIKYVLPNLLPSILPLAALQMAAMIVFEATLSFLGMGIQPPTPSWGGIMAEGRDYLEAGWWITTLPGIAIFLTSLALTLLADGLQKAWGTRVGDKL